MAWPISQITPSQPQTPLYALNRFSAATPAYHRDLQVSVGKAPVDIFAPLSAKEARIVLVPKANTNLGSLIQASLKTPNPAETIQALLQGILLPDAAKKSSPLQGVNFVDVTTKPAPAADSDAATQDKPKGDGVARKNTEALVQAFNTKLAALNNKVATVTTVLPEKMPKGVNTAALVRELATRSIGAGYNYRFHRSDNTPKSQLASVLLNIKGKTQQKTLENSVKEGVALGRSINLVRHLVDSPSNYKTTRYVSDVARQLASPTLKVDVHSDGFLEGKAPGNNKAMGLFLSVSQGNDKSNPDRKPRLVEMTYTAPDFNPKTGKTILLVGKGIIFDTGGNDLKPSMHQHNMRGDMAGAAAVMGTLRTLDEMQLSNVKVIGLMPFTENRINGASSLQQDIYTSRSGKKVEITNTDAEGRLVLADAMNYGMEKYKNELDAAFTIATLTGGKVRSVGEHNAIGIAGNNKAFLEKVDTIVNGNLRRTTAVLPLNEKHYKMVTQGGEGQADVINASGQEAMKYAGVISVKKEDDEKAYMKQANFGAFADGAAFIQAVCFDPKPTDVYANGGKGYTPPINKALPWAHFDIAGAEFEKRNEKRGNREWASGIGVEDLYLSIKAIGEGTLKPSAKKTAALGDTKKTK